MRHLICPFWSNKCTPSIRLQRTVVWASHFCWNDLSASWIYTLLSAAHLRCCENTDLNLCLCHHDKLPWPVMQKLTSRNKHSRFLYLRCVLQNINTVIWVTADVLLEEEISSDKERLSMKLMWKKVLFELARGSSMSLQVKQQHPW